MLCFSFRITFCIIITVDLVAPVAQGIEHQFPKLGVAGSIPAGGVSKYKQFAALLKNCPSVDRTVIYFYFSVSL